MESFKEHDIEFVLLVGFRFNMPEEGTLSSKSGSKSEMPYLPTITFQNFGKG